MVNVNMTDLEHMRASFEFNLEEIVSAIKIDGRAERKLSSAMYAIKDCRKELDDELKGLEGQKKMIERKKMLIRKFDVHVDDLDDLYRQKLRGKEIPDAEYDLIMKNIHSDKAWALEGYEWTGSAETASTT